ncbi:MAG: protein of unknown function transrane [Bacteroidetes bacterium]|nr:protein of unknown function transrane [Bacteroidota bacterium]
MKESVKGHIALISANIIFGFSAPFSKLLFNSYLSYSSLLLLRSIGGAILFWGASLFIPKEKLSKKEIVILIIAAFVGVIFNQGLYMAGLARTTPIHCGLLQTLGPVYTLLLATFILKEPFTLKKLLGVLVGMSGALILIFSEYSNQNSSKTHSYIGDILVIASGVAFALYLTLFMNIIKKYNPITIMKWMFLFSSIVLTPFYFHELEEIRNITFSDQKPMLDFILYLGYIIIAATFIGYLLISFAQKRIRPTIVSMYVYIQPIIMTILSIMWGLGTFNVEKLVAALLIFVGVYIVTRSKKKNNFIL